MIPVPEAIRIVLEQTPRLEPEPITLTSARGRVLALDLSFNMTRDAAAAIAPGATTLACAQADLLALPVRDDSLDLIFSTAVFHWIRDHERLFAELHRALRPGGRLVAQCGGGPNLLRLRQRANALMRTPRFAEFFASWSEPWEYPDAELAKAAIHMAVAVRGGDVAGVIFHSDQGTQLESANRWGASVARSTTRWRSRSSRPSNMNCSPSIGSRPEPKRVGASRAGSTSGTTRADGTARAECSHPSTTNWPPRQQPRQHDRTLHETRGSTLAYYGLRDGEIRCLAPVEKAAA